MVDRNNPRMGHKENIAGDAKWLAVTSNMTLSAAADLYFQFCHNQPYSLFYEESFCHHLVSQTLPEYLCLALLATASRFSHSSRPLLLCADQAWEIAIERSTANIDSAESLTIAQTIHLLCIIDYSSMRSPLLNLNTSLSPDPRLRPEVQEEYRHEKGPLRFKIRIAYYVFRPTSKLSETAMRIEVQYLNSSLATHQQLPSFLNIAISP
ncbi:hypothetical protein H9Q69_008969 [Fusarium xylarioides]|nr:hypothetical protein H9Q69_008969 [Fusarium xylarioides]